jgi:exonuclease SbcD
MRTVEAALEELLQHETCHDYVFVQLLDETPVLQPMEKIRSVYPNAMHVERSIRRQEIPEETITVARHKLDDLSLLQAFYKEMKGTELSQAKQDIFLEVLEELRKREGERI